MTVALLLFASGFLLAVLLFFFVCRRPRAFGSRLADGSISAVAPGSEKCDEVLDRIFGPEDADFIRNQTSEEVQRLFIKERKALAFLWLSEIRNFTTAAMHFHVAGAGKSDNLQSMQELRLAIDYAIIQAKCGFIAVVLSLYGPTAIRSMAAGVGGLSDQARALVEMATTNPMAEKMNIH